MYRADKRLNIRRVYMSPSRGVGMGVYDAQRCARVDTSSRALDPRFRGDDGVCTRGWRRVYTGIAACL